jgi:iron complex transport system ATP-binding protein
VSSTCVEIQDLSVRFGDVTVLDSIDWEVPERKFIGLVGPNGAGKTTLLRTLNGTLAAHTGEIRINDRAISELTSKAVSRTVATVHQDTGVAFDFDVETIVEMGRTPYRNRFGGFDTEDAAAVEQALARANVAQFTQRSVTTLSGGERQRVMLARALAQETPLLLLDEPTASLDIHHQVRTLQLVRELLVEGKTVIAAIHDLNLASQYCDLLAVIVSGEIIAFGPPRSVLTESIVEQAFDATAVVFDDPVTGSVSVRTLASDPSSCERDAHIHVIGGGGAATPLLYDLQMAGYTLSCGVVQTGGRDAETAHRLDIPVQTVDPYASVSVSDKEMAESMICDADCTIIADINIAEGNIKTIEAAAKSNQLILVEDRPFSERNDAGKKGERLYGSLHSRAEITTLRDARQTLNSLTAGSPQNHNTLSGYQSPSSSDSI